MFDQRRKVIDEGVIEIDRSVNSKLEFPIGIVERRGEEIFQAPNY